MSSPAIVDDGREGGPQAMAADDARSESPFARAVRMSSSAMVSIRFPRTMRA